MGYLLLQENVPERNAAFAGTMLNISYSFSTLMLTFYYRYISQNSSYIFYLCLTINFIVVICTFYLPESVKWLISVQRYREAKDALRTIAHLNGVSELSINSLKRPELVIR